MSLLERMGVLAAALIAVSAMTGAGLRAAEAPGFVGAGACRDCHTRQVETWTGSHHDWALKPAAAPFVLGDFDDAELRHDGAVYRFRRDGEDYWFEETAPDGESARYRIAYAVGVTPLQQYLADIGEGRLQALDVAWDTENKRWFHLYPDQTPARGDGFHWTGPYKTWNARCAECHQTDFRKNYDAETRRYSSRWSELNVACEACHGAGEGHVAWAEALTSGDPAEALAAFSGVDGSGFPRVPDGTRQDREVNLCFRCHSRREPIGANSPPAAAPFADHYRLALLEPGLYFPDGQIRDEVYVAGSFMQSRMFAKGVTCSNCHDPHSLELVARDNALCAQCHNPAGNDAFPSLKPALYDSPAHHRHEEGSKGALCVSCHMPETTYMQVDPRRDHSFRVPRPDLTVAYGVPNACNGCHADKTAEWAAETVARWYPDGRSGTESLADYLDPGLALDNDTVVDRLVAYANDLEKPAIGRASVLGRLRQAPGPAVASKTAGRLRDGDPLVRAAASDLQAGARPQELLDRLAPLLSDPVASVRLAAVRNLLAVPPQYISQAHRDAYNRAMGEYMRSLQAKADFPETQMAIGGLGLVRRDPEMAKEAFATAAELDPQLVEAWRMRARIAWATGDAPGGLEIADEGLKLNPKSWLLMATKAEILSALGRNDEAVRYYGEAERLMNEGGQ